MVAMAFFLCLLRVYKCLNTAMHASVLSGLDYFTDVIIWVYFWKDFDCSDWELGPEHGGQLPHATHLNETETVALASNSCQVDHQCWFWPDFTSTNCKASKNTKVKNMKELPTQNEESQKESKRRGPYIHPPLVASRAGPERREGLLSRLGYKRAEGGQKGKRQVPFPIQLFIYLSW